MKDQSDIPIEYRVVGEDRWAPFRRWLMPKAVSLLGWSMTFTTLFVVIYTIRFIRGDFS